MTRSRANRFMLFTIIGLVLVFGSIFGFINGKQYLIDRYLADYKPPPVSVAAEAARAERWERSITAVGSLKAAQGVDLATESAGTVKSIRFRGGDSVAAGTELLSLVDDVEVATLKSLLAQRRLAEINFERDQRLLLSKAISRTDFDKTDAQLKDVSAQVEKTEAIIARKHIRAPFAGRIGIPLVDEGEYLTEGKPVVTLQALDTLEVDFSLPEQHLPELVAGQRVRCLVQAYPDQGFDGRVRSIDAKIDDNTRNVLVRAEVPNTALQLLPGMFVRVDVIVEENVPVITVPETAVSYNLYGDSVFVVDKSATGELRVERRYITAGVRQSGRVAIDKGIAEGERVVIAGALKLDDGAAVVIGEPAEPAR